MIILIRLKPDGEWHRRSVTDPTHTACHEPIGPHTSREHRRGDNQLCKVCFTRHEIDTGKIEKLKKDLEQQAETVSADREWDDDDPTPVDRPPTIPPPIKK